MSIEISSKKGSALGDIALSSNTAHDSAEAGRAQRSVIAARSPEDVSVAIAALRPGERIAIGRDPESCALAGTGETRLCRLEIPTNRASSEHERCDLIIEKRPDGSLEATSLTHVSMTDPSRRAQEEVEIRTRIDPGARLEIRDVVTFVVPNGDGTITPWDDGAARADARLAQLVRLRSGGAPKETYLERQNRTDPLLTVPGGASTLLSVMASNEGLELKLSKYDNVELNRMLGVKIELEPGTEVRTSHLLAALQPLAELHEPFRTILQRDLTLKFISDFTETFAGGIKPAGTCCIRTITLPVSQGPASVRLVLHEAMHKLTMGDKGAFPSEARTELSQLHREALEGLMGDLGLAPDKSHLLDRYARVLEELGPSDPAVTDLLKEMGANPDGMDESERKLLARISYYSNLDECFAEMGFYILDGRGGSALCDFAEIVSGDRGRVLGTGHFDELYARYGEIVESPEFRAHALLRLALSELDNRLRYLTPREITSETGERVPLNDPVGYETVRRGAAELDAARRDGREPRDVRAPEFRDEVARSIEAERAMLEHRIAIYNELLETPVSELMERLKEPKGNDNT